MFWGLESSRLLQDLPYWALPFLPPLAFWALVATLDRGRLVDEVRYLRTQLLRSERPRTANGVDAAAVE